MPEFDLSQTALIIKANESNGPAEDALRLKANKDRLVLRQSDVSYGSQSVYAHPESRECTPAVQFAEPELHLRFDGETSPSLDWRFGYEDTCEVKLGMKTVIRDCKKMISHIPFRIFFNFRSGILVLRNESKYGTTLLGPSIGENGKKILMGNKTQALHPAEVTTVKVADLELLLYYPTLSRVQKIQHEANWRVFVQNYKDTVPELGQLALSSSASTRPPTHRAGYRNGYTMLEEIGNGNYGTVRRAVEYQSGAVYAVKEFFKNKAEAHSLSEIATLRKLTHVRTDWIVHWVRVNGLQPHIVKFVDMIADGEGLALVMEFMPYGNLKDQHLWKKLSLQDTKTIIRQVLEGIEYLHGNHIVHRDMKPENILLKTVDPLFAVVTDFGLAARDGFLATECGTKKYAAPEIYKGSYNRSIDIWSIGATAFDIAEGLPNDPDRYSAKDWAVELQCMVTEAANQNYDPFFELLKDMLDIDPNTRPSAKACLADRRLSEHDQFALTPTEISTPVSEASTIAGECLETLTQIRKAECASRISKSDRRRQSMGGGTQRRIPTKGPGRSKSRPDINFNQTQEVRPRCNRCGLKHIKCDRGDVCGSCKSSGERKRVFSNLSPE